MGRGEGGLEKGYEILYFYSHKKKGFNTIYLSGVQLLEKWVLASLLKHSLNTLGSRINLD